MSRDDFFRFVRPCPKEIKFRNGSLFFIIKKEFPDYWSLFACKGDISFAVERYDRYPRVILATVSGGDRETLVKLIEAVGFQPKSEDGRRIMASLVKAGIAVRV